MALVVQRALVNVVNDGRDHVAGAALDRLQQRRQPVNVGLDVAVQEDERLAGGLLGAKEPRANEARARRRAHQPHHCRQLLRHRPFEVLPEPAPASMDQSSVRMTTHHSASDASSTSSTSCSSSGGERLMTLHTDRISTDHASSTKQMMTDARGSTAMS